MKHFAKKHIGLIIIIIIVIMFPAGLSNQAKLNMRTIVTGLAIDKSNDEYEVTAQIVKTISGTESSGIGAEIEFISDKAKTISKALAKLLYKAGKVSAFSHTNFIILGGDILKEDATDCLDIFMRDKIIKNSALILFSKEKASDEIKKTKNLELSVGLGLQKVFSFKQEESEGLMMTVLDFLVENNNYGRTSVASVFELQENKENSSGSGSSGSSESSGSSSSGSSESSGSGSSGSSESSGSSSSGSSESGGGISSDSQSSSGGDKNSKVNFNPNAPLNCFVDGKFAFEISEEDELLAYMITHKRTKISYIEIDDIKIESLKNTIISIVIRDKSIHKKIRFENEIPCLDLKININEAEINEVISGYEFNHFSEEEYESIKESLKNKISESIGKLFEKGKSKNADIFMAYKQAYRYNYSDLTKYYKNHTEFLNKLKLNVEINIRNMEN